MLLKENNPWLGLESYSINDSYRFYGRDHDIEVVSNAIYDNFITTIYGISGAGKTSLLNAGLTPALISENYLPIRIRLNHSSDKSYSLQIIDAISDAIDSADGEVEYEGAISLEEICENEKLWFFLHTRHFWTKDNYSIRPVIFIDQFEEIFTKNEDTYKISSFFEMVNAIQYDTPPSRTKELLENGNEYFELECNFSRMVFVIREDFLARLEDYSYGIAALRRNRIGIKQMNGHQALEVILNPITDFITRDVAIKILSKVSGKEVIDSDRSLGRLSIDTSILSLFCSELYQRAVEESSGTITDKIIEEYGNNIISQFYTKSMTEIPSALVTYLEKHLLTSNGFRNSIALEDIEIPKLTKETISRCLLLLSDKRIIRIEDTNGIERVEFTHDVLCKVAKQHKDNISKSKELKRNRWVTIVKSLDFLIILILSYLSLKNGDKSINGQAATLRLLKPNAIAIGLLFYYSFLRKRSVSDSRTRLVASVMLSIVLMNLPDVLTRYNKMDIVSIVTIGFFTILTILLSFFTFKNGEYRIKKSFIVLLIADVLWIALSYTYSLSGLLVLFSFLILLPYRYSNDKKSYVYAILCSILNLVYFLINDKHATWNPLLPFVCILYPLTAFLFKAKDNTKTCKSSLTSCLTLEVYQSHGYLTVILLIIGVLNVFLRSINYGGLISEYNILNSAFVAGLSVVFLVSIFKMISSKFRDFTRGKPELTFWSGLMASIITIIIFSCTYIPYGFLGIILIWGTICVILIKLHKRKVIPNKISLISSVVILFISTIVIPLNCIGYNIASHIQYARVPGTLGNVYGSLYDELIVIKDIHGNYGVRDRYDIIVPVEFEKIIDVSSEGIDIGYRRGLFSYDYDSDKYYEGKYFPRYNTLSRRLSRRRWHEVVNTSANLYDNQIGNRNHDISEPPYVSRTNIPKIMFLLRGGADSLVVWECNKHLNDKNLCTSLIRRTAESRLSQDNTIDYALEYLSLLDKADINTSLFARKITENQVKFSIKDQVYDAEREEYVSKYVYEDAIRYPLNDLIKKFPEYFTYNGVEDFLNDSYKLLTYVDDTSFVKLILDTLYTQKLPNKFSAYERWQHYNKLSLYYLYGEMPVYAEKYASMAIQIDTMMKYSYLRKVEASILKKNYAEAEYLMSRYGNDMYCEGPLWEGMLERSQQNTDSVALRFQYNFRASLAEDLKEFESVELIESPYDEAYLHLKDNIESNNDLYNSTEIKGDYRLCRKYLSYDGPIGEYNKEYVLEYQYYMKNGWQVTPCYKTYAEGFDKNILLVIDEFSHKRIFINMLEKIPVVVPGEFDHAWRFSEGLAAVSSNGKLGFINKEGEYVIDTTFLYANNPKYSSDKYKRQQTHFVDFTFHSDLCPMIGENDKYGLINKNGDWILDARYDDIEFLSPFNVWLLKEYKESPYNHIMYGAVDSNGNILLMPKYNNFITIGDEKACWGSGDNYLILEPNSTDVKDEYEIKYVSNEFTGLTEWFITHPSGEIEKYPDNVVDATWSYNSCY